MDKKSFIRGFGVGVLFAAIILGTSFVIRTSDSFVESKAKEMGMVYQKEDEDSLNLAKSTKEPEVTKAPKKENSDKKSESTQKATIAPKITPEVTAQVTSKPTEKPTPVPTPKKTPKPTKKPVSKKTQPVVTYLTIDVGDWSSHVSEKLESLGVIKSAKDFDHYLNTYGYSSSIVAGTFQVSSDDSYAELARKITGK